MKIVIMGAGGIGGCYGGLLANAGTDVTLIARGSHLAAIQQNGLRVIQPENDFSVKVDATNDPSKVGPVDILIFAVKTYQNTEVIPLIKPLVGNQTTILTIQNGVESAGEIAKEYGAERVIPGSAYVISNIDSPGVIKQRSPIPRIGFGESNGELSERATKIQEKMSEAGITAELSDDIARVLWSKALYNSPANGLASTARVAPRDLMDIPEGAALFESAIQEVASVATASGVPFDHDDILVAMNLIAIRPHGARGSMQIDVDNGRPLELEAMVGSIGRIGRSVGVPTPIFDLLYTVLLPHINGRSENQ